jgi:DNA polymerase-1
MNTGRIGFPPRSNTWRAPILIGHNIQGYDLPVLNKLYGWSPAPACVVIDTLIAARLILPNLDEIDGEVTARTKDAAFRHRRVCGRYSIEAFGVRLGMAKVGTGIDDWSRWTPEMQARCAADVAICKALWQFLQPDGYSRAALDLEHRIAAICERITADGVPFDRNAAERLHQQLSARRAALEAKLQEQFPGVKLTSRERIGKLLEARGWVPEKRTDKTGKPSIDDELLETIGETYPEFSGLSEYYILGRRLAQIADGSRAWLRYVDADGRIHGGLIHIGTPHSRAKHLEPNLAQVPNPKRGKPLATECRALFRTNSDWVFVACDQGTLQDRGFAHYLAAFDDGAYAKSLVSGVDQHWQCATALGLTQVARDKESRIHTAIREGAKQYRYAFLFGAGALRGGQIIAGTIRAVGVIDPENALCGQFWGGNNHPSEGALRQAGARALERFMAATPGLRQLRENLTAEHRRRGWIEGLDGRRVPTGADYKALNRIVTASEAIICKQWLAGVYDELCARFRYGLDVYIALWIHDELVAICRPELAEAVGEVLVRHAKGAGEPYGFRVALDAEFKVGRSWAGEPIINNATPNAASKTEESVPMDAAEPGEPDEEPAEEASRLEAPNESDIPLWVNACLRRHETPVPDEGELPPWEPESGPTAAALEERFAVLAPLTSGRNDALFAMGAAVGEYLIRPGILERADVDAQFHRFLIDVWKLDPNTDKAWGTLARGLDKGSGCKGNGPIRTAVEIGDEQQRTLAFTLRLWERSKPIAGTLAANYLSGRGIDLGALPADINETLRFHPRCPFGRGVRRPCLIALFRDVRTGDPAGIHRIALTPGGHKLGRMALGKWPAPRAIKLWPAGSTLVVGEGIETVLAGATRIRHRGALLQPAWSMAWETGVAKLPVLPGVERLIILVDHDPAGKRAARQCAERWRRAGHTVVPLTPNKPGTDFNDIIMRSIAS